MDITVKYLQMELFCWFSCVCKHICEYVIFTAHLSTYFQTQTQDSANINKYLQIYLFIFYQSTLIHDSASEINGCAPIKANII